MLRALWQVVLKDRVPDFRQPPYDLGAFENLVHTRGSGDKRLRSFEASFELISKADVHPSTHRVTFEDRQGHAFPSITRFTYQGTWIEVSIDGEGEFHTRLGEGQKVLHYECKSYPDLQIMPLLAALPNFSDISENFDEIRSVVGKLNERLQEWGAYDFCFGEVDPFASAPIRSRPRRTYDPSRPTPDPEGEYIPDYFASMSRNAPAQWEHLKSDLEDFGRDSGLFDEIAVLSFGKTTGSPFQVQIRKFGKRLKGPKRNLIDVGYGVSQALPILAELLREDSPKMFLLQQPEDPSPP